MLLIADGCQSKIDEHGFPAILRSQHNILQFDIPVHNSIAMHANQCLEKPTHNLFSLFLTDAPFFVDAFEEVTSTEVFGYHEDGSIRLHNTYDFDDVGMVQHP